MRPVALLLAAVLIGAAEPPGPAGAEAVIRIGDARWLEREAARFAASLGQDPTPIRRILAERLYGCRSLDGIDTLRPALLWWRTASSPLSALIPLVNRRQFADDFGVGSPPLVRVGERDGTVVYAQNHPEGVRECRLLVVGDHGAVARTADEAERLAARAGELLINDPALPALRVVLRGSALTQVVAALPLPAWAVPGSLQDVRPALSGLVAWIGGQADSLTVDVRAQGQGTARLTVVLVPRPDTELAGWALAQQNQPSRLGAVLEGTSTGLILTFRSAPTGRLEAVGEQLVPHQAAAVGPGWTPAVSESWRQSWRLAERLGEVALGLDVTPHGAVVSLAAEQPRASEQVHHLHILASAATADSGQVAEVLGLSVVTRTFGTQAEALTSGPRHVVAVRTVATQATSATQAAARLAQAAAQAMPPKGSPAIVTFRADLARLVHLVPGVDPEAQLAPTLVTGALMVRPGGVVAVDIALPLEATAAVLSQLPGVVSLPGRR